MNRTKSLIGKITFIGLCALALAGCYYEPAPYYASYAPAPAYYSAPGYYYGPPVTGSVYIGGGWGHGWHDHDHWR